MGIEGIKGIEGINGVEGRGRGGDEEMRI